MDFDEYSKHVRQFYTDDVPPLLLELCEGEKWNTFLEAGCGDGPFLFALNRRHLFTGKTIHACDISQLRIDLVKRLNPDMHCFASDVCAMNEIQPGSIDIFVSTMVLEHVPDEEAFIRETSRVLSPGGTAYITTVFKKTWARWIYKRGGEWRLDPTHVREYTETEHLFALLKKHNLKVKKSVMSQVYYPPLDNLLIWFNPDRYAYLNSALLRLLRKIKVPQLGFYCWELVLEKKS